VAAGLRLAVVAHKGGAGKTVVAANLAAAAVGRGRRVVAVDCDPQGGLGAALGVQPGKPGLYEVLAGRVGAEEALRECSVEGLMVLPADLDLAGAEVELPGRRGRWQLALDEALRPLDEDLVVIDTAPGLGVLPYVALAAAQAVVVACPADFLALRVLRSVFETVEQVKGLKPGLAVVGIVPTMTTGRTRHEADVLEELARSWPGQVLGPVPRRVVVQDAALAGMPVSAYDPRSPVGAVFDELTGEVLQRAEAT
jgi:chromosome partitioning protein